MKNVIINGVVGTFPSLITGNASIARLVGKKSIWGRKPERIAKVFGVRKRLMTCKFTDEGFPDREVSEEEIAFKAASKALAVAECLPEEIGLLVVVSGTASSELSKFASTLAYKLHCNADTSVIQLSQACSGFLSAVGMVNALLQGNYLNMYNSGKKALIITSNVSSQLANRSLYSKTGAHSSLIVFGDGAAAAVLDIVDSPGGILGYCELTDPNPDDALISLVKGEGSDSHLFASKIEGAAVMKYYVSGMTQIIKKLENQFPDAREADHYFVHQPRSELVSELARQLEIDPKKVPLIVQAVGNIGPVFIPVLMAREMKKGKLHSGDRIVCAAIGDGNKICGMYYRMP
jgi:3-oxoacyl-[acyl-carrier-protein] synthase III